jgi:hypothetical protein
MPISRGRRPLKRWRYVGVYTPDLMLCVGDARIGAAPQRWWAVALPDGSLHERTTVRRGGVRISGSTVGVRAPDVEIDLELGEGTPVEVASPASPGGYIWTGKQAPVPVRGRVVAGGRTHRVQGDHAFIDDSAGYHDRHTVWKWSAGLGRTAAGARVAWNLVTGIHDGEPSERTVWVDGEPREVDPVRFADDLSRIEFAGGAAIDFSEWSSRDADANMLAMRSRYRQPFGTFSGELPGGLELAEGYGVMEDHDVLW